jgi:uncharacterized protein
MDDASTERIDDLPLFPLPSTLFPAGRLDLRIFEVRYLDMIARCQREDTPFGVVALNEGSEVLKAAAPTEPSGDGYARESFFPVGTLARIEELHRPQAGLMLVRCIGTRRFRVRSSAKRRYGLWIGEVDLLADDTPAPVPDDLAFTRDTLQKLVANIEHSIAKSGEAGVEIPLTRPYRWDDCGWIANRWCEMLPLGGVENHRMLALESPLLRLELVADALGRMGFPTTT